MLVTAVVLLLLGLLTAGVPVAFALLMSGAVGLYVSGGAEFLLGILRTSPLSIGSSYEMITIPMFMLMAELVILSGIADDIFDAASAWVGRVPGGLAMATAIAGAGFGAISGSSTASAATLSSTSIPAMLKQGYEPRLACGVVAISGTLAMLIPPSIALVLYGIIAEVSVGKLLVAGVIPGLLVTLVIMATVSVLVRMNPSRAPPGTAHLWIEKLAKLRVVGPMIVLFVLVTGLIYLGISTPTEASALGALGALMLAGHAGKLSVSGTMRALRRALHGTGMIMLIIIGAQVFGYFITVTQSAQDMVRWAGALPVPAWVVLCAVLSLYLVLGCLMEQIAILVLTVPVVLPVMVALGYDPIWFGVIVIVMGEVGLVTPPVGLNVFVVARFAQRPLTEVFEGVFPHVLAHLLLIALLCVFPSIILWLPSTMK